MLRLVLHRLSQPSSGSSSLLLQAVQQPSSSCTGVLAGLCSRFGLLSANQQLHSLAALSSRTQQQHSLLPLQQQPQQRTFASSSLPTVQQQNEQQALEHKQQPGKQRLPVFWNGLSSKIGSRKPAIKRPARHQWHYCSLDYDPMEPVPEQYLPPYAPARAHSKNYGAIFAAGMPKHNRNRWVGIGRQCNVAAGKGGSAGMNWDGRWLEQQVSAAKCSGVVRSSQDVWLCCRHRQCTQYGQCWGGVMCACTWTVLMPHTA
jgi:hypothetical protein